MVEYKQKPCIRIEEKLRQELIKAKIHKRETFGDVIERLLEQNKK